LLSSDSPSSIISSTSSALEEACVIEAVDEDNPRDVSQLTCGKLTSDAAFVALNSNRKGVYAQARPLRDRIDTTKKYNDMTTWEVVAEVTCSSRANRNGPMKTADWLAETFPQMNEPTASRTRQNSRVKYTARRK
jgi:hypothetical protein